MKVSVLGATGAMGKHVVASVLKNGYVLQNKVSSKDSIESLFYDTDVVIDFSCPMATETMLSYAKDNEKKVPMIIGTTGLSSLHEKMMQACSGYAPVFHAPNMSVAVSMLNAILGIFAKLLNDGFDVEIFERHHKLKKDAPSGTALMFGKTIAKSKGDNFPDVANFARYGVIPQRKNKEIGFSVQRCGNTVGVHKISFVGEYEDIEISHNAHSRKIFSDGAVRVAAWIYHREAGIYTMDDYVKDMVSPVMNDMKTNFFE